MSFIEELQKKAQANPQRVVFPESGEEKILKAACCVHEMGIAHPILVGEKNEVTGRAEGLGLSLQGITIVDHTDSQKVDELKNLSPISHTRI